MASLLLERGIVTHEELSAAMFGDDGSTSGVATATAEQNDTPQFEAGDKVRVKPFSTGIEWQRPHLRTPGYIYGAVGVVERYTGVFQDPSFLAFGWRAPSQHLYRVKFRLGDIWPEQQALKEHICEATDQNTTAVPEGHNAEQPDNGDLPELLNQS